MRPLLLHLQGTGVDVGPLLAASGIEPARVFEPDALLPHGALVELWTRAADVTRNPALAAHILAKMDIRLLDLRSRVSEYLLVHVFSNSDDVGTGLTRYARFYALVHSGLRLTRRRSHGGATLTLEHEAYPHMPASLAEFLVGSIPRIVHATTHPHVAPAEVFFAHAAPPNVAIYDRLFRAPVRFSARGSGVRFDAEAWQAPLTTRDPVLAEIAQRDALDAVERLCSPGSLAARARVCIEAALRGGDANAKVVSGRLGMSTRTLARRLAEEGTGFKDLVDDVRKARAEHHLRVEKRTVPEVAALLGFADASAFSRAYSRWFGTPPRSEAPRAARRSS